MIEALLAGLFGLLIGSFLNVCIYRLPRDLSVWQPARSYCPECERTIAWYDNIPLLSYLFLRGKCRACGTAIPLRYLLVELLCGILFFSVVYRFRVTAEAGKWMTFAALNVGLIFADLEERILPDEFTKGGVVLGLIWAWFVWLPFGFSPLFLSPDATPPIVSITESLLAAGIAYGLFRGLGWAYEKFRHREGLGMGDMKMVAMMGAFLGLVPMMLAIMIGSMLGSVLGMIFIKWNGEDSTQYELPFGSFLGVGALAAAWLEASHVGQ